jgi:hypothetical protein
MVGRPLPRLLASLAIGLMLAIGYWLAMESVPRAMLAEVAAAKVGER